MRVPTLFLALVPAAASASGYGKLPLHFEPTPGRGWIARSAELTVAAVHGGEAQFYLPDSSSRVTMRLRDARLGATPQPELPLSGVSNYYLGSNPLMWRVGVPHYGRIRARNVYPNIDLVYYAAGSRLEFDFVVSPGADPQQVELVWEGADSVRLEPRSGDIVLATAGGEIRQHKPRVLQRIAGRNVEIAARYEMRGTRVAFEIEAYDDSQPLVIDPVISYTRSIGGSDRDKPEDIAVDGLGSAYIVGHTLSANFPVATAHDPSFNGHADVFVTKLAPDGTGIVYSTYLGGAAEDLGLGITVDNTGAAYITGSTRSTDFPVRTPFRAALAGESDAFAAKFGPTGALVYSTYLGGAQADVGSDIAIGSGGEAHITGGTYSSDFPMVNPIDPTRSDAEAFVAKLAANGSTLLYSTYLGGVSADWGIAIAVDVLDEAHVLGVTQSPDFPLRNPLQAAQRGYNDAFVTKLTSTGSAILYSTFLGGSGYESPAGIAIDTFRATHIVLDSDSADFPLMARLEPFVSYGTIAAKISTGGQTLIHATLIGAGRAGGIAVTGTQPVVSGIIKGDFPLQASAHAHPRPKDPPFVTRLTNDGRALIYSTLHNTSASGKVAIALDSFGNPYITGHTVTGSAGDTGAELDLSPVTEGFAAKFTNGPAPAVITITSDPAGLPLSVDGRTVITPVTQEWQPGVNHLLSAPASIAIGTGFHSFTSWSQGGPAEQTVVSPAAATAYTARYSVTQCVSSVSPLPIITSSAGGLFTVAVSIQAGCRWTAESGALWARVRPSEGQGSGLVTVSVGVNSGQARFTAVTVAGKTMALPSL